MSLSTCLRLYFFNYFFLSARQSNSRSFSSIEDAFLQFSFVNPLLFSYDFLYVGFFVRKICMSLWVKKNCRCRKVWMVHRTKHAYIVHIIFKREKELSERTKFLILSSKSFESLCSLRALSFISKKMVSFLKTTSDLWEEHVE